MTSIYTTWDPARAAHEGFTIYNNNLSIATTTASGSFFQTADIDINPYLNNGNPVQFTVTVDEYSEGRTLMIGLATDLTGETELGGAGSFGFRSDGFFLINDVVQYTPFPAFELRPGDYLTLIVYPNDRTATLNDVNGNSSTYSIADLYTNIFNTAHLAFTPNDNNTIILSNQIFGGDNHDGVISIVGGVTPTIVYPPYRQILNLQPDGFFYLDTTNPIYTTHVRMISLESIRIILRESANKIESFMIYDDRDTPLIMIPYQSAITNYSATIQSSSIGLSIQEPAEPIMALALYYISSVDGQRYQLTDFYQCTASFVTYNYQA
jgi:hypothetical protein